MCHNFSTYNLVLEQVKPMFFKNARHSDFNQLIFIIERRVHALLCA